MDTGTNKPEDNLPRNILYYVLTPVYESLPNDLVTAACVHCAVTGEQVSGYGGPVYFAISPKIIDGLKDGSLKIVDNKK